MSIAIPLKKKHNTLREVPILSISLRRISRKSIHMMTQWNVVPKYQDRATKGYRYHISVQSSD